MGWRYGLDGWRTDLVLEETPLAEPLMETLAYVVSNQIPLQLRFLPAPTDLRDGDLLD